MRFLHLLLVLIFTIFASAESPNDRYLSLPNPEKCKSRFKEFQYDGKNYFYSGHDKDLKDAKLDWLDARNTCRERCMETVSIETQAEFDFIKEYIEKNEIKFIWTSGRLCDFAGCEGRWDLLPKIIKGWLWSANQKQIDDTNKIPKGWTYQPWSSTGHFKRKQPDNAEFFINQATESCLGILNNKYNDSVAWHDIACYHKTGFICEDSAELISEAQEIKSDSENSEEVVMAPPTKIETTKLETTSQKPRTASDDKQATKTSKKTTTVKPTSAAASKETTTTTSSKETSTKQASVPDFLLTTVTSRFRPERRRPTIIGTVTTTSKSAETTRSTTVKESTTKKPEEEEIELEEPETVTAREEMFENVSVPELILNMEEIMPFKAAVTKEPETTTKGAVSTTRKLFLRRKLSKESQKAVETTAAPAAASTAPPASNNPRKFLLQRKRLPGKSQLPTSNNLNVEDKEVASILRRGPIEAPTTEEPRSTKKISLKRKKIFGKLRPETASTEEPTVIPATTESSPVKSSSESVVIVNENQADLQNIEETTSTELLTTQVSSTTEEISTTTEEQRAIPIKRKKVKIYRKVIKLRTSTEKVVLDGPLQNIDDLDTNGDYAATVIPPIAVRRNFFKPKFRPSRLKFNHS